MSTQMTYPASDHSIAHSNTNLQEAQQESINLVLEFTHASINQPFDDVLASETRMSPLRKGKGITQHLPDLDEVSSRPWMNSAEEVCATKGKGFAVETEPVIEGNAMNGADIIMRKWKQIKRQDRARYGHLGLLPPKQQRDFEIRSAAAFKGKNTVRMRQAARVDQLKDEAAQLNKDPKGKKINTTQAYRRGLLHGEALNQYERNRGTYDFRARDLVAEGEEEIPLPALPLYHPRIPRVVRNLAMEKMAAYKKLNPTERAKIINECCEEKLGYVLLMEPESLRRASGAIFHQSKLLQRGLPMSQITSEGGESSDLEARFSNPKPSPYGPHHP